MDGLISNFYDLDGILKFLNCSKNSRGRSYGIPNMYKKDGDHAEEGVILSRPEK